MNVKDLVATITPDIYQNLKRSLELGKWPDGNKLTPEQKQHCMDMIILYENHNAVSEQDQTGFINRNKVQKTPCESKQAEISAKDASLLEAVNVHTPNDKLH